MNIVKRSIDHYFWHRHWPSSIVVDFLVSHCKNVCIHNKVSLKLSFLCECDVFEES